MPELDWARIGVAATVAALSSGVLAVVGVATATGSGRGRVDGDAVVLYCPWAYRLLGWGLVALGAGLLASEVRAIGATFGAFLYGVVFGGGVGFTSLSWQRVRFSGGEFEQRWFGWTSTVRLGEVAKVDRWGATLVVEGGGARIGVPTYLVGAGQLVLALSMATDEAVWTPAARALVPLARKRRMPGLLD